MKPFSLAWPVLAALTILLGASLRADEMASLTIDSATGEVTLEPRWSVGPDLAGFHYMAQDLSLGGGPTQFYSVKGTPIPVAGDISAFAIYNAASGAATNHADIGSKLRPNAYTSLTGADPDLGYGAIQFYFIHHKSDGDYFAHIVPGSGSSSSVADLKPMSQPGGPSTGGASGYFGLTFAASDLGYGANLFYYLRNHPVTGYATFGSLVPALAGTSTDHADLGIAGYNALAYTPTDVGYGTDQLYYQRLDPVTGYTILGSMDPSNGQGEDIANLGSIFATLTFVVGDVGFGTNKFYTTGALNPNWQSVSFAAIPDRAMNDGAFTVVPSASSGLPLTLTVVPGSTGTATISGPVGGVFAVTPTSSGRIVLQATQAGQAAPTAYEFNMLRQGFSVGPGSTVGLPGPFIPREWWSRPPVIGGPAAATFRLLVDFNRDRNTDLLWRDPATGEVAIWLLKGTGVRSRQVVAAPTSKSKKIFAAGDFNGDGRTDVFFRDPSSGKMSVWLMKGKRVRSDRDITTRMSKSKKIVAAGDFNGDGRTDLVWQNSAGGSVGIWVMRGKKHLSSRFVGTGPRGWQIAGAGDFNRDGNVDLLWHQGSTGAVDVWFMDGTTFASSRRIATRSRSWQVAGTGDFNRDGRIDIMWRQNSRGPISVWLMNDTTVVARRTIRTQKFAGDISN